MGRRLLIGLMVLAYLGAVPPYAETPQAEASEQVAPPTNQATDIEQNECPYGEGRDSAELCEQWRAATATEATIEVASTANLIDGLGAILTALSVLLLIWTLRLTRKQLRITENDRDEARAEATKLAQTTASALSQATRSADAANALVEQTRAAINEAVAANEIARANHEQTLRPYILVSTGSFEIDDNIQPIAHVELKNFGQSPAIGVETWHHIWVAPFPLQRPLPRAPDDLHKARSNIGPGGTSDIYHPRGAPLNPHEQAALLAGRAALYVYGESTYQDVFGNTFLSEFTLCAFGADSVNRRRLTSYSDGNHVARRNT